MKHLVLCPVLSAAVTIGFFASIAAEVQPEPPPETGASADVAAVTECESRVFTPTYVSATDVADKLNRLLGTFVGADGRPRPAASAFEDSNSVAVYAPARVLDDAARIIAGIDRRPQQVYVEARFVELTNSAEHEFGIHWDMFGQLGGAAALDAGYGVQQLPSGLTKYTQEYSNSNFRGKESMEFGRGGKQEGHYFNGSLSFSEMRVVLSSFEESGDARMFSNPKVIVSSGKEAVVDITRKRPNVIISGKRVINGNNSTLDTEMKVMAIPGKDDMMFADEAFYSWGIMLRVRPRVTTNGVIHVEIVPTLSDVSEYVTAEVSKDSDMPTSRFPILDLQRIVTEFDLRSGDTAVIGGLSRTREEAFDSGIPYLSKIPWIGDKLFGYKGREKVQKDIIVFVTVGLADADSIEKDAGLPKNAVLGRQYTNGVRLEPGDSTNAVEGVRSLDLRSLEERSQDVDR